MGDKETRIPQQKRSIEKKQKIKNAAVKLMSSKGYFSTSSNEIAKEAGVSIGTFYSYFKDKKTLYTELVEDVYVTVTGPLKDLEIPEDMPLEEVVRAYITMVFKGHEVESDFQREIASLSEQSDEFRQIEMDCKGDVIKMFEGMLEPYSAYLKVKDLNTASYLILTSTEAVVHDVVFHRKKKNKKAVIDELTAMICNYLF